MHRCPGVFPKHNAYGFINQRVLLTQRTTNIRLGYRYSPVRSGPQDDNSIFSNDFSPHEHLSGEANTNVADVLDVDRTFELLTYLFSSFVGKHEDEPAAATGSPDCPQAVSTSTCSLQEEVHAKTSPVAVVATATAVRILAAGALEQASSTLMCATAVGSGGDPRHNSKQDGEATQEVSGGQTAPSSSAPAAEKQPVEREVAVLGGGCFWCTEACFRELRGVLAVTSGYAGGHVPHPTYQQVLTKTTGHAEVVKVEYDPAVIGYRDLLRVFMSIHDPTTPNRSGNDVGPQYRSIILTTSDQQRVAAEEVIAEVNRGLMFWSRVCTEVAPLKEFYAAEPYHQRYFSRNPGAAYCAIVVQPKLQEFRRKHRRLLMQLSGSEDAL